MKGRRGVAAVMGCSLACLLVLDGAASPNGLGASRDRNANGTLVVQLRNVRRHGFEPYPRSRLPRVLVVDSQGHSDTLGVDLLTGRATFTRVRVGRVLVQLLSTPIWVSADSAKRNSSVHRGRVTVDTLAVTSTLPRDMLRDVVDQRAGMVWRRPFDW